MENENFTEEKNGGNNYKTLLLLSKTRYAILISAIAFSLLGGIAFFAAGAVLQASDFKNYLAFIIVGAILFVTGIILLIVRFPHLLLLEYYFKLKKSRKRNLTEISGISSDKLASHLKSNFTDAGNNVYEAKVNHLISSIDWCVKLSKFTDYKQATAEIDKEDGTDGDGLPEQKKAYNFTLYFIICDNIEQDDYAEFLKRAQNADAIPETVALINKSTDTLFCLSVKKVFPLSNKAKQRKELAKLIKICKD